MKKMVCLTALWIANILLLAHAAIPHHYHKNTGTCFAFHCRDSKEAHQHEHHEHHTHQHEGNPSSDRCSIDDVYTTAQKNIKTACCSHIECDCGQVLLPLILDYLSVTDFGSKVLFKPKPYFVSYYTEYITQSLGLRAPPNFI